MNMTSMAKGITAGIAAGTMVYAVSNASNRQKRKIKHSTGKALRAIGDMVEGIGYMMR